jgi:hypothetical protein
MRYVFLILLLVVGCSPETIIQEKNVTVEVIKYVDKECPMCAKCSDCAVCEVCKDTKDAKDPVSITYVNLLRKLEYLQRWQNENMNATYNYENNCSGFFNTTIKDLNEKYDDDFMDYNKTMKKLNEQYNTTKIKLESCKVGLCKWNNSWC